MAAATAVAALPLSGGLTLLPQYERRLCNIPAGGRCRRCPSYLLRSGHAASPREPAAALRLEVPPWRLLPLSDVLPMLACDSPCGVLGNRYSCCEQ